MIYLIYTIHIVVCLFLILVVLLQQGKGADLSVFGGGSTQAAFGARGAATLLHKMTVGAFIAFIATTITIGFLQGGGTRGSVMSTVVEETAAPATAAEEPVPPTEALPPDEVAPPPVDPREAAGGAEETVPEDPQAETSDPGPQD